jgi:hypothetical protein
MNNNDIALAEYTALRNEILHFLTYARQYQISGVIAITLLFWWSVENPSLIYPEITLLFIYTVVLLTYFLMRKRRSQARRAAAYIAVFLEDSEKNQGWENRLEELNKRWPKCKALAIQEDFLLSLFLGVVGWLIYSQWISVGRWKFNHLVHSYISIAYEIICFLVFVVALFSINKSFSQATSKFTEQWIKLKNVDK